MDAGNRPRADVIDQVAEHNAIHERRPQVFVKSDFQSHFNALWGEQESRLLWTPSSTRPLQAFMSQFCFGYKSEDAQGSLTLFQFFSNTVQSQI